MKLTGTAGQALVESALVLLLVVVLLVCLCRGGGSVLLKGKAESVALQAALRHGRLLSCEDPVVRREVFGEDTALSIARKNGKAKLFGISLPVDLTGRTSSNVSARWGNDLGPPSLGTTVTPAGTADAEVTCDSWHGGSGAGRTIRKTVSVLVASGWIQ